MVVSGVPSVLLRSIGGLWIPSTNLDVVRDWGLRQRPQSNSYRRYSPLLLLMPAIHRLCWNQYDKKNYLLAWPIPGLQMHLALSPGPRPRLDCLSGACHLLTFYVSGSVYLQQQQATASLLERKQQIIAGTEAGLTAFLCEVAILYLRRRSRCRVVLRQPPTSTGRRSLAYQLPPQQTLRQHYFPSCRFSDIVSSL